MGALGVEHPEQQFLHGCAHTEVYSTLPILSAGLCSPDLLPLYRKDEGKRGGLGWGQLRAWWGSNHQPSPCLPRLPGQQLQKIKAHGKNSRREELVGLTSGGQKQLLRLSRQEVKEEG